MKPCTCNRCSFFYFAALSLAEMGDQRGSDLSLAEITWEDDAGNVAIFPMSSLDGNADRYLEQWTEDKRNAMAAWAADQVARTTEGYTDAWSTEVFN